MIEGDPIPFEEYLCLLAELAELGGEHEDPLGLLEIHSVLIIGERWIKGDIGEDRLGGLDQSLLIN